MGITHNLVLVGILSLLLTILNPISASEYSHHNKEVESLLVLPSMNSAKEIPSYHHPRFGMMPSTVTELRRHIRSVDQGIQQSNEPQFETEDGIQSNSEVEEDSEVSHKSPRSYVSSDVLRYLPPTSLTRENEFALKNRWYFPGFGHFSRGGRADTHFIRFGRNANFDGSVANLMSSNNMNPNKKNNFIRLGRENPRQNNFIRLGRSGWASNERFGSKVGYFPDYYSNLSGAKSNAWSTAGDLVAPSLSYDNTDVPRQP